MNRLIRRAAIGFILIGNFAAAQLVMADSYSTDIPSLTGNYPLDTTHNLGSHFSTEWATVDFGHTFTSPLMSIKLDILGNIRFPENIDNSTGDIVTGRSGIAFFIGPDINQPWLGSGFPIGMTSYSNYFGLDLSANFLIDPNGNFRSTVVFNNVNGIQGYPFFSSFDNGGGALGLTIGYDMYDAWINNQSFYNSGSLTLSGLKLTVSTDQFQVTSVPVPPAFLLFVSGIVVIGCMRARPDCIASLS